MVYIQDRIKSEAGLIRKEAWWCMDEICTRNGEGDKIFTVQSTAGAASFIREIVLCRHGIYEAESLMRGVSAGPGSEGGIYPPSGLSDFKPTSGIPFPFSGGWGVGAA